MLWRGVVVLWFLRLVNMWYSFSVVISVWLLCEVVKVFIIA